MSGPPLAGHVSALCVRLEILRAASASLSLTGPQRPDCATPGLSSSAPGPSPTGRGPDSYPRRLSPPTELNTLPSAPRPQPPCRPSRALGPPPSSYCSVCLSQPPVPSAPSCSSRVALRTWFCPSLHTSHRGSVADRGCRGCRPVCRQAASPHQAGKQERVRTPQNSPRPSPRLLPAGSRMQDLCCSSSRLGLRLGGWGRVPSRFTDPARTPPGDGAELCSWRRVSACARPRPAGRGPWCSAEPEHPRAPDDRLVGPASTRFIRAGAERPCPQKETATSSAQR